MILSRKYYYIILSCIINIRSSALYINNNFTSMESATTTNEVGDMVIMKNESIPISSSPPPTIPETLFLYKLPGNYNKYEFPTIKFEEDGPFEKIPIFIGVLIQSFRGFDEVNEKVTMELDLSTEWLDFHIRNFDNRTDEDFVDDNGVPYVALDSSFLDNIWWPDMMFSVVISVIKPSIHETDAPKPVQLRVHPGGLMKLYSRVVLTLSCPMNFQYYPADTQTCLIKLRSYAFSNNDIVLDWNTFSSNDDTEAVFLLQRTDASFDFHVHNVETFLYKPILCPDESDTYTFLQFSISGRRKLSFHILQTFLPSILIVAINCLSFCIPINYLEARIGISMTTLLTLTAMFSSIKEYTPHVSYIKAIDVWMMACIVIVFATLVEFSLLIWLSKATEKKLANNSTNRGIIRMTRRIRRQNNITKAELSKEQKQKVYKSIVKLAESFGFFVVVGSFILFNFIFWPWMLISSNYYNYSNDKRYNVM